MRKALAILLAGGLMIGLVASAHAAPKPVTVWEDVAGDADAAQGLGQSIPAGWDLTAGTIAKNGANLEFTVTHADMPPVGSAPEASRFLWNFVVDGTPFRLSVKSVDIGKPDVPAGQTTERVGRVDVSGQFRLEDGACTETAAGLTFVNCAPLEYLGGSFDPASMSFTAIVPMKSVGAKTGSLIQQGPTNICSICWISHTAERSSGNTIIDSAGQLVTYKVPKK